MECLVEVEAALLALSAEVAAFVENDADPRQRWRENFLVSVKQLPAVLGETVKSLLSVADSDGWLSQLEAVRNGSLELDLRRESAQVTIGPGHDGVSLLTIRTRSNESLSMMAPLLLDELSTVDGKGVGYYLAIFPEAREAVAFLDRCVRGAEQLGSAVRQTVSGFRP